MGSSKLDYNAHLLNFMGNEGGRDQYGQTDACHVLAGRAEGMTPLLYGTLLIVAMEVHTL